METYFKKYIKNIFLSWDMILKSKFFGPKIMKEFFIEKHIQNVNVLF